jgi:serine/threonine-protein kinase
VTPDASTLGKYRLVAELGEGGMAHVYLAVVQGPGGFAKLQVIKRIRSEIAEDPEFVTMFMDEARLAARLNHPNIVQTNEVGNDQGRLYIAMEYLDGQSFEAVLRRAAGSAGAGGLGIEGGMPLAYRLRVVIEMLAGLQHAHELADYDGQPLNVVHRDVSPHNVFVTYDGQIKLVDFGIAKAADGSLRTRTGVFKGKCAYMALEQFDGADVDRRADIFSVGAMLWQIATGRRLWRGLSDMQIYARLGRGEIPHVLEQNPAANPRLAAIAMRALSARREDRQPTAAALAEELEALLASLGEQATAREVGRWTATLFADRREQIRKAIELQLKGAAPDPRHSGEVPVLAALLPPGSDPGAAFSPLSPDAGQTPASPSHSGARMTWAAASENPTRAARPSEGPRDAMPSNPSGPAPAIGAAPARRGLALPIVIGVAVAAVALATAVVLIVGRGGDRAEGDRRPASGAARASAGERSGAAEPSARTSASIGGAASARAPRAEGSEGAGVEGIDAGAPDGGVPLDGAPARAAGTAAPAGATATSTTAPTTKPTTTAKSKPTLDESDPWK